MGLASLDMRKLPRETAKRRQHERCSDSLRSTGGSEEEIGFAGGEATDPHQLVMWCSTRMSADKAVAPTLKEFEEWLEGLQVRVEEASRLRRDR